MNLPLKLVFVPVISAASNKACAFSLMVASTFSSLFFAFPSLTATADFPYSSIK